MKLAGRSEVQFHRYGTPSQIPRYRDTDSRLIAGDEFSQPIRRKRTAEFVYCIQSGNGADAEVAGHEYNESNFSFHQYTNSATSLETICTRATTAKPKDDTDVIAAQKSTPRTGISSATSTSSIKQSSKRKPPFQPALTNSTPTVSLSFTTATAKSHRKKRVKKSGSGPVPNPPPTVFNVEHSSPLSGLVNLPSAPRPACSLDDTSPCDIDTLPSIPSPPGTMPQNNTTTASFPNSFSYSASSAPFSTPYDDDALLENEIPFPLNKHSNIIIENMGVKKAKNLHKAKESLLNRYITTVRPDLPPHSGIADFETLPLRPLCQNKPAPSPSEDIPFQHCFSRPTTPGISTGPSSSKKDAWGCMHLGAADYELSIAFPHASHYEVWDMDDEAFFACPVFLCLMVKNPIVWTGTPISLPDASLIVIRCDDLPVPSSMSVYDPSIEYGVQCTVPQKSTWNRGPPSSCMQGSGSPFLADHDEITIDGKWERAYVRPKVQGRDGQTRIFRIADGAGNSNRNENGMVQGVNGRGWYLKFWIPIPARLFLKRETRIFEIRASVWMMGDEERVSGVTNLDGEEVDLPLVAETEMTVSHLRTERDMRKMY